MMLANLPPSPAAPAAPGAAAPAAAATTPVTPGTDAAAPFASWLLFDSAAAGLAVPEGDTDSAGAAPTDVLAEPGMLPDSAAPPVAADAPDQASTPAMSMTMSMTLPLGIVLPPAMPMTMPSSLPAAMAAPVPAATPLGAAAAAPVSFAAPAAPAAAATPAVPAAPFAAALPAAPASTVSFTFSAPPAASASSTAPADSASDSGAAAARTPAAAPLAVPPPALAAAPAPAAAPRAPVRTGDSGTAAAPLAQNTGVAATAQPIAAATADSAPRSDAPVAGPGNVMSGANALASQSTGVAAPLDLKLPANPADWQQPLRDALGERLQLQLGRNIDQAVIRLDPPQLGRIEIAIRHAAGGVLEVNISATHSEVRRQLGSVSDAMRSDLAQRHFSDVAVTITATPRSGAAFGEQQGRQRQPERDTHDNDPGRALAEAGHPSATFSLSGREVAA
ncbi:flagellar hook-length control protein FliK [Massilia sp. DJPM01]|uniref:flagellar hook-length control protein FliK n=1 Tax=Massilia sp. DJPM01 TaxID=3024404 RepID=UPI00259F1D33|nr:flagellar hook-length control protein FliK [Massilia sp. DJPM01]MDM5178440.1 flagellar hook-length control protein FliK [Massilia sp. DJPM01]